ncbi:MAG: cupin domain-containing protein, partial [Gemmataceae bacterium]
MQTFKIQAPYDRYSVAFPELGIAYLAEVEWKKPRPHRVHDHHEMQVLWMLAGTMGLEIDGRRLAPPAGACYVIPAGRMHNVFQLDEDPTVVFLDLRLAAPSSMIPFLDQLTPRVFFR